MANSTPIRSGRAMSPRSRGRVLCPRGPRGLRARLQADAIPFAPVDEAPVAVDSCCSVPAVRSGSRCRPPHSPRSTNAQDPPAIWPEARAERQSYPQENAALQPPWRHAGCWSTRCQAPGRRRAVRTLKVRISRARRPSRDDAQKSSSEACSPSPRLSIVARCSGIVAARHLFRRHGSSVAPRAGMNYEPRSTGPQEPQLPQLALGRLNPHPLELLLVA